MNENFDKGQMEEVEVIETLDEDEITSEYSTDETNIEKVNSRKRKAVKVVKNFVIDFCIAVLLVIVFLHFFQPNFIYQESMYPTYTDRDMILVSKMAYNHSDPERGDIIVFTSTYDGNKRLIKRVIGIEGDTVVIHDGNVWVNGIEQNQSYTNKGVTNGDLEVTVPEDSCFVLGDNRTVSIDSRSGEIGFVGYDTIVGKVMFAKPVVLDKEAR